jgi:hypothetical protein
MHGVTTDTFNHSSSSPEPHDLRIDTLQLNIKKEDGKCPLLSHDFNQNLCQAATVKPPIKITH